VSGDGERPPRDLDVGAISEPASRLDPHAILESIPEPVGLVDRQGHILAFNAAARRVVFIAAPTQLVALGDDLFSFISPHNQAGVRESLDRAFAGEAHTHKTEARGYHFETVYSPVRDPEGGVVAAAIRVADVTAREAALAELAALNATLEQRVAERAAELERVNAELERAARAKDAFLASMSHELRTPLTGILGSAELLRTGVHGPLNDRQLRSLGFLEDAGRHLYSLLSDILDLARIGAERLSLEPASCALGEVCESALAIVRGEARKKGIDVAWRGPAEPVRFVADARRMRQVLVNLLSNAIKFAPAGGSVELSASGDGEAGLIRFEVRDTGPGIAPEDFPKLFQPFTQLDTRLSREHAGTGLGLALVRSLAELHGGHAEVESEPGKGSRFRVVLPWRRPVPWSIEALGTGAAELSGSRARAATARVLLVEDDDPNRTILGEFLRMRGFTVDEASTGSEALACAASSPPDLVVLDIQLPGMDGLEVLARLRASGGAVPPVLALTALAMAGDKEKILAAGADAYLAKPASLAMLGKEIDRLLASGRGPARA
jgi:PAS domain S-box-containing protein